MSRNPGVAQNTFKIGFVAAQAQEIFQSVSKAFPTRSIVASLGRYRQYVCKFTRQTIISGCGRAICERRRSETKHRKIKPLKKGTPLSASTSLSACTQSAPLTHSPRLASSLHQILSFAQNQPQNLHSVPTHEKVDRFRPVRRPSKVCLSVLPSYAAPFSGAIQR